MEPAAKAKSSEKRQRQYALPVRFSDAERVELEEGANRAGLSLGSYVRAKVLTAPAPRAVRKPPIERAALAQLLAQAGRIAGSLYQLARDANFREAVYSRDVQDELAALRQLRNEIRDAMGRKPL